MLSGVQKWNIGQNGSTQSIIRDAFRGVFRTLSSFKNRAKYTFSMFDSFLDTLVVLINSSFNFRSSHRRYFVRKGVLRNFTKFTGKRLC